MQEKSTPLISIIIPVYNSGKYLQACLESIINQTYRNLEIILVDDGSTDNSPQICDDYQKKDARIVCVHQSNGGVSSARNHGLKLAKGEYIHFPDSDDYLELDTYEYLINLINKHQCDVVNFEHYITYPQKEIAHKFSEERYGLFDVEGSYKQFVNGVQFCWNKLFKRKLIFGEKEEKLYFREDVHRGEDTLFAVQAISRAEKVWFDSRPLYHYVQSNESATRGKFRTSQLSFLKLYDLYEPIYKNKYPDIWNDFLLFKQEGIIMIYFDMWMDKNDYKDEKKSLLRTYRQKKKLLKLRRCSVKRKIKLILFSVAPNLFCLIHKVIHKI